MKCPRCGLAELNRGECPICHMLVKRNLIEILKARIKLSPKKIWNINWSFYEQTKPFMILVAAVVLIAIIPLLIESANFLVVGYVLWFTAMVFYDIYRKRKGAKE